MKYLLAYSIPIISMLGIHYQGVLSYSGVLFAFVLIPLFEIILPTNEDNYSEEEMKNRLKNRFFDFLLYLNIPIVYGILFYNMESYTK